MSRQRTLAHAAFARGQEENWVDIDDAQERKRVQNRLAQRSYRHKVRERLQELAQLRGAEQGNSGLSGGDSTQASAQASTTQASSAQVPTQASAQASAQASNQGLIRVHWNTDALERTTSIAPTVPAMILSTTSDSGVSTELSEGASSASRISDSPISSSATQDKGAEELPVINDFFTELYCGEGTDVDTILKSTSNASQSWTAISSESTDYGYDLFGPLDPSAAQTQSTELKFTELMLKIRDMGFADMESMILGYYSTQFSRESLPYWLQRRSRQQNLHKLLEQLEMESCCWPAEERVSFQEGIKRVADRVFTSEFAGGDALLSYPFPLNNGSV